MMLSKCYFPHTSVKDCETAFPYNFTQYVFYIYILYIYISIISGWGKYTVSINQNKIIDMSAHFGSTYTKIGTIQRRLAWRLRKDDMQIHKVFHIFIQATPTAQFQKNK